MVQYQLQITGYEPPDRGDPNGGWRVWETITLEGVTTDQDALAAAESHVTRKYGAHRIGDDVGYSVKRVVRLLEVRGRRGTD